MDENAKTIKEAIELITTLEKSSPAFLQRKLMIGYARAFYILHFLEEIGIVGKENGAKPREILFKKIKEVK